MNYHFDNELDNIEQEAQQNYIEIETSRQRLESISAAIDMIEEDSEMASSINTLKENSASQLSKLQDIRNDISSRLFSVQNDLERMTEDTNNEQSQLQILNSLGENISDLEVILSQRIDDIHEQERRLQEIRNRFGIEGEIQESEAQSNTGKSYNNLTEYFHDKNYPSSAYSEYSQDPHWRMLMRKEHPEIELPPLDPSVAKDKLQQYIFEHNYKKEDYPIYSKDPIWQELHKAVYPDFSPTRFESPDYIKGWRLLTEHVPMEQTLRIINPNYGKGKPWSDNCQRCGPAYEMRRRGFDVIAQPVSISEYYNPTSLMHRPFDVWESPSVIHCRGNDRSEIEAKMREWGDGARAQIAVKWKNVPSGHIFIAEQKNGVTVFVDPQNGKTHVNDYFNRIDLGSTEFCRIDNLQPSKRILECCKEV